MFTMRDLVQILHIKSSGVNQLSLHTLNEVLYEIINFTYKLIMVQRVLNEVAILMTILQLAVPIYFT